MARDIHDVMGPATTAIKSDETVARSQAEFTPLSPAELAEIRTWIEQGAPWPNAPAAAACRRAC